MKIIKLSGKITDVVNTLKTLAKAKPTLKEILIKGC